MLDYVINTGLVGMLCGAIIVVPIVSIAAYEDHYPPRKTVGYLILGFAGCILTAIFIPFVILALLIYTIISLVKNDWTWYESFQRKNGV